MESGNRRNDATAFTRGAITGSANPLAAGATPFGNAPVATESAEPLRAIADAFARIGFDVDAMLARMGMRRADLDDPDALVPCTALGQLVGAACAERRVPNLGARVGSAIAIGAFPLLDYLILTTDTVGASLEQLARYFPMVAPSCSMRMVAMEDSVRLLVEVGRNEFLAQFEVAIAIHHLREETNGAARALQASLIDEPDDVRDLERLLGCPVQTPSSWNGIEFSRATLAVPLRRRDPALRRVLEAHAAMVPRRHPAVNGTMADALRDMLAAQLARGVPDIETIARASSRLLRERCSAGWRRRGAPISRSSTTCDVAQPSAC